MQKLSGRVPDPQERIHEEIKFRCAKQKNKWKVAHRNPSTVSDVAKA
jgi:hypothetical protein